MGPPRPRTLRARGMFNALGTRAPKLAPSPRREWRGTHIAATHCDGGIYAIDPPFQFSAPYCGAPWVQTWAGIVIPWTKEADGLPSPTLAPIQELKDFVAGYVLQEHTCPLDGATCTDAKYKHSGEDSLEQSGWRCIKRKAGCKKEVKVRYELGGVVGGPPGSILAVVWHKGDHDEQVHAAHGNALSVAEVGVLQVLRLGSRYSPAKAERYINQQRAAASPTSPMVSRGQVKDAIRRSSTAKLAKGLAAVKSHPVRQFYENDPVVLSAVAAAVGARTSTGETDRSRASAPFCASNIPRLQAYVKQLQAPLPWLFLAFKQFAHRDGDRVPRIGIFFGSDKWSATLVSDVDACGFWPQSVMSFDWTYDAAYGGWLLLTCVVLDVKHDAFLPYGCLCTCETAERTQTAT